MTFISWLTPFFYRQQPAHDVHDIPYTHSPLAAGSPFYSQLGRWKGKNIKLQPLIFEFSTEYDIAAFPTACALLSGTAPLWQVQKHDNINNLSGI
jgi:hypothetical protein